MPSLLEEMDNESEERDMKERIEESKLELIKQRRR
jgi:hypothetical protein